MSNSPFATEREALNAALMAGTAEIHRTAERVPFMVALFKGELPREAYAAYLANLWYVYESLEDCNERLKDDPLVGQLHSPELFRRDALEADLRFFVGEDWRATYPGSPAAKAYAERIREVASSFPPAYAPHHWLRYLGYVLGQDLLRKLVGNAYGIGEEGMNFYSFPQIEEPKVYLRAYHARMNAIEVDADGLALVIEEGVRAFQLQIDLTEELAEEYGIAAPATGEADQLVDELAKQHP
jgi:heme oxygenase (biliverdin-producing, ferredoxin)